MYFLDPQHGERRRAMVRNKANQFVNDIDESINIALQDARNRARGVLSEMTARLSDERTPDWILEERLRSNLGRTGRYTRGINIRADQGRIYLSGPALREDQDTLVKAAMRTRGVHGVENQLQVFDNPQDIPALQSAAESRGQIRSNLQHNWSPSTRLLSSGWKSLTLYGLAPKAGRNLCTAGCTNSRGLTSLQTHSLGLGLVNLGSGFRKPSTTCG
jgi:osmotically-inducible protein OsmY